MFLFFLSWFSNLYSKTTFTLKCTPYHVSKYVSVDGAHKGAPSTQRMKNSMVLGTFQKKYDL